MNMTQLAPWNWLDDDDGFSEPRDLVSYPVHRMQRELNRMMDLMGGGSRNVEGSGVKFLRPTVNISECDKAYHLEFDVPGVKKEDLDVNIDNGRLTLRGERRNKTEEKGHELKRVERSYGSFQRTLPLPEGIDTEQVEAKFEDGVLQLTLPKTNHEQRPRKKIQIT